MLLQKCPFTSQTAVKFRYFFPLLDTELSKFYALNCTYPWTRRIVTGSLLRVGLDASWWFQVQYSQFASLCLLRNLHAVTRLTVSGLNLWDDFTCTRTCVSCETLSGGHVIPGSPWPSQWHLRADMLLYQRLSHATTWLWRRTLACPHIRLSLHVSKGWNSQSSSVLTSRSMCPCACSLAARPVIHNTNPSKVAPRCILTVIGSFRSSASRRLRRHSISTSQWQRSKKPAASLGWCGGLTMAKNAPGCRMSSETLWLWETL